MIQSDVVDINRSRLILKPYALVGYKDKQYKIINIISSEDVVISDLDSGRCLQVSIKDLKVVNLTDEQIAKLNIGDEKISDKAWDTALFRYELIKPLIEYSSVDAVLQLAKEKSIHETTIWKWLKAYRVSNSILALVPKKRGWTSDKTRLSPQINHIILQAIQEEYLNARKPSIAKTIYFVKAQCSRLKLDPPHDNTIRNKIWALNEYKVTKARLGKQAAQDKYQAAAGSFPNADYPLAYVQIDHTKLDIEIVDDEYRQAIGRPHITVAIDVFSRMIVGYYISLEAPSATSVAMCTASAILSKKRKLIELDIDAEWDAEGLMDSLHSDNGPDFRTNHLSKACLKYGIHWEYRPIGGKQFGGHIERMLGVVNLEMHILDGTTKSNIIQKGTYDSAKHACLTLSELEYYLVYWITKIYHNKRHSTIEMSPLQKWNEGIWGNKFTAGTGLKERVADENTLFLDFAPEFESTIQKTGVKKDKLFYFADCLRPWINHLDPDDPSKRRKKKFLFKRDPRDISMIWFYEPNSNRYFKVPTAKREIPPISLFEYRQVQTYLRSESRYDDNQEEIYQAILHLREKVDEAKSLTRKQRRANQRRKENSKVNVDHHSQTNNEKPPVQVQTDQSSNDLWQTKLTAFDDLR